MKKLTQLLIAILIGLNLSGCDPQESFYSNAYLRTFQNNSDMDLKIVYHHLGTETSIIDTLNLTSKDKIYFTGRGSDEAIFNDDFKLLIEENVNLHNTFFNEMPKFELYVGDKLIKEWKGKASYLGSQVNSPYNYDSWEVIKYNKVLHPFFGNYVYGEIIFTITNEDLE